ncbi:MAG: TorA maturation chaperone TorD [Cryomorphaceae bacterium]
MKKSNPPESPESIIGLQLLLAELLHREIDESLLALLRQPEVSSVFTAAAPLCADYIHKDWSAADYEQAAVDFCGLFLMPETACAARAAAWLPIGGVITAETIDTLVYGFVSTWSIEVPANYQTLTSDHASLLLYLSAVIRQSEPSQVDEFEAIALRSWLPVFGSELSQTTSPLYSVIGQLLVSYSSALSIEKQNDF